MTATHPAAPSRPADALTRHPIPQLRRLVVVETESEVVITGRVASFYQKQLAQEALRPTVGPRRLINQVVVTSN